MSNSMDCSPPGSSVHGISQARIVEWAAISFSRGSSWTRNWTHVSCIGKQILYTVPPGKPKWENKITPIKSHCSRQLYHLQNYQLGKTVCFTNRVWHQASEFSTHWWGWEWNLSIISTYISLIMKRWASCCIFFAFSLNCLFFFLILYIWSSLFTLSF